MLSSYVFQGLILITMYSHYSLVEGVMFDILKMTNFCSMPCPKHPHIACNNNFKLHQRCPRGARNMLLGRSFQEKIVYSHNMYRNMVATGEIAELESAARMATISWDTELGKLAELNAMQCVSKHDNCRNTIYFRNVGQNLGVSQWLHNTRTINETITEVMDLWFEGLQYTSMDKISSFSILKDDTESSKQFTQIIQQKATHVGCGVVRYVNYDWQIQLFTCNYSAANVVGQPVYEVGPSASKCRTGTNPSFSHLCSAQEKYN